MVERWVGQHVVVLRDDRITAAYVPDTMQVFELPDVEAEALDWLGPQVEATLPEAPLGPADPPTSMALDRRTALLPLLYDGDDLRSAGIRPWLGRLTLNISNACNLFCTYCYADKGLYHAPQSFMSPDAARNCVERVNARYSSVNLVQFFGGEPLMNVPAIDATCEAFTEAAREGRGGGVPSFVATTNGTVSTPPVLAALKRWHLALTVSHDGPRDVHDANRPARADGTGSSYDRIAASLVKFQDADVPLDIECTFGRAHLRAGVSVVDLLDFFTSIVGPHEAMHISPAFLPRPAAGNPRPQRVFRDDALEQAESDYVDPVELIPLYREATRLTMSNFFRGDGPMLSFAVQMIQQLVNRTPSVAYCPAFFDQLSVATNGDLFPCFMFIGDPRFNLGNLFDDAQPSKSARAVFQDYVEEFGESPVGGEAWYSALNTGCVAGDFITASSFRERALAPLMEAIAEECILGLARFDVSGHARVPVPR